MFISYSEYYVIRLFHLWFCKKRRVKMGEWFLGSGEIDCCQKDG